jgi:hypothetical protein
MWASRFPPDPAPSGRSQFSSGSGRAWNPVGRSARHNRGWYTPVRSARRSIDLVNPWTGLALPGDLGLDRDHSTARSPTEGRHPPGGPSMVCMSCTSSALRRRATHGRRRSDPGVGATGGAHAVERPWFAGFARRKGGGAGSGTGWGGLIGDSWRRCGRAATIESQSGEVRRAAAQFNEVLSGGPPEPFREAPRSPGTPDKTFFVLSLSPQNRRPDANRGVRLPRALTEVAGRDSK